MIDPRAGDFYGSATRRQQGEAAEKARRGKEGGRGADRSDLSGSSVSEDGGSGALASSFSWDFLRRVRQPWGSGKLSSTGCAGGGSA